RLDDRVAGADLRCGEGLARRDAHRVLVGIEVDRRAARMVGDRRRALDALDVPAPARTAGERFDSLVEPLGDPAQHDGHVALENAVRHLDVAVDRVAVLIGSRLIDRPAVLRFGHQWITPWSRSTASARAAPVSAASSIAPAIRVSSSPLTRLATVLMVWVWATVSA